MNEQAVQRLRNALEADAEQAVGLVAVMTSAEELHHFALIYNTNDDLGPIEAIAEHPLTDAGTILYLIWQFSDILMADRCNLRDRRAHLVLDRLTRRYGSGQVGSERICYDPVTDRYSMKSELRRMRERGIDEGLLKATPGTRLKHWGFDR
jgi:hypothetical protein